MEDLPGEIVAEGRRFEAASELHCVLLVEDDEDDAVFVSDLLEAWPSVRVDVAQTMAAAGVRLGEGGVDCVLLDLNLPDAVGLEALERLMAHEAQPAVVVLTGDTDDQRGIEAVAAGAQDYLVKGHIGADTLMRAIRYAVERRGGERSRQELALARAEEAESQRLQRGLLPAPLVQDERIRIGTAYRPGHRRQLLGGDFYDIVQDGEGRVHAVVGDVCGHGPDEAALGVRLRMAWRTLILAGAPAGDLFTTLDRVLVHERDHDEVFTSLAQVTIDPGGCAVTVRLAGHPAPILTAAGTSRLLEDCAHGPLLGVGAGPDAWPETRVELGSRWTLLVYTDGLYEGRGNGGQLTTEGLLGVVAAQPVGEDDEDPGAPLERIITEVERLNGAPLTDDVAILSLGCDLG